MTDDKTSPEEIDPLELAAPVAERVKILRIVLADSKASRTSDAESNLSQDLDVKIDISNVEIGIDAEEGIFVVKPSFKLEAIREGSSNSSVFISIEASFVVVYSLDSITDFNENHFKAFADTNGIFNAWPYWREFVQSMINRMGLPAITVPVFRV